MVAKTKQICGSGLPVETCGQLDGLVMHDKTREFSQSKRDVIRHALPEIVNHVSDTNVEVAASISEQLVEYTLTRLDRINSKLVGANLASARPPGFRVCVCVCVCAAETAE